MKTRQKGFTLIELLLVIAIIGVLSAIVIVSTSAPKDSANFAAMQLNIDTIEKQAAIYYIDGNTYGAGVSDCETGMFADPVIVSARAELINNITGNKTLSCSTSANGASWAVIVDRPFGEDNAFCFDSTGHNAVSNGVSDGECTVPGGGGGGGGGS